MMQMGPLFKAGMMVIWHLMKVSIGTMLILFVAYCFLEAHRKHLDTDIAYKELAKDIGSAFDRISSWAIIYLCITKVLASYLRGKRSKGIGGRTAPGIEEERAQEREDIFDRFPSLKPIVAPKRSDQEEYIVSCACWDREVKEFFNKEKKWRFRDLGRAMLILLGGLNIGLVIILGTIMEKINGFKNCFKSGVHFYEELGLDPGDARFASRFSCFVFVCIMCRYY